MDNKEKEMRITDGDDKYPLYDPFDDAFKSLVKTTDFLSACYQNAPVKKEAENG